MTIIKYLDPKNDIAFKKLFGTEKNKGLLIHFLNDVLSKAKRAPIINVDLIPTTQLPEIAASKVSSVDVLCTDQDKNKYIVEMQVSNQSGFEKRAQYYAAKAYSSQLLVKGEYHTLKEVIFLALADFVMFPNKPGYKSEHVTLDRETLENDLQDFSFTFLELPKFKKKRVQDLKTYEEKWLHFFKYAPMSQEFEELAKNSSDVIHAACQALEAHNWTHEELQAYEQVEKAVNDALAREHYVTVTAREEGLAKGREEGIEKGRVEGRIEGRVEGELNATIKIATKLIKQGLSLQNVAETTGLSEVEVEAIQVELTRVKV